MSNENNNDSNEIKSNLKATCFITPNDPQPDVEGILNEKELKAFRELKKRMLPPPEEDDDEETHLSDQEKEYCHDRRLLRYLRARDLDVDKAEQMIRNSIVWRRSYRPQDITYEQIKDIANHGSLYVCGHDKEGCPVIVMKAGAYNPYTPAQRLEYVAFLMEKVFNDLEREKKSGFVIEKATWILDFSLFRKGPRSQGARQVMRDTQDILQNQYPETLKRAILVDPPWFFSWLFKIVSPFMSAKTKAKIEIVRGDEETKRKTLSNYISPEELEKRFGGERETVNDLVLIFGNQEDVIAGMEKLKLHENAMPNSDTSLNPENDNI